MVAGDASARRERLVALRGRLELLVTSPGSLRRHFTWVERPVLRILGWRPTVSIEHLRAVLLALDAADGHPPSLAEAESLVEPALSELEHNVRQVERACRLHGRAPIAYAAWLWRTQEVMARICAAFGTRESWRFHGAASVDPTEILPPMMLADGTSTEALQVAAVDQLLDAARSESELLGRRRRLLEAAREMLLDVAAAVPLGDTDVALRHGYIAREIALINRLEASGVDPQVSLVHQARQALTRGERQRFVATLTALQGVADRRGDERLGRLSHRALEVAWRGADRRSGAHRAASRDASARDLLGHDAVAAVSSAFDRARAELAELRDDPKISQEFVEESTRYLASGCEHATLAAAIAVDGLFEVGGTLAPVRVVERDVWPRAVPYPARDLVFVPAERVEDVKDAVVEDPRLVLYDLATGRLQARRYMRDEVRLTTRVALRGEVRVYLLDGSGSMLNARGRMRDAIILAELSTLRQRLDEGKKVVLYYRYFDNKLHPTHKVSSQAAALAAIEDVLSTVRAGGTDIQAALLASFEQIREACAHDPELVRAQIVLVTDGEAAVDEPALWAARCAVGDVPVAVSIIALGQENPALRALAAKQRAAGERAFYHFVSDAELTAVAHGERDGGAALHLPAQAAFLGAGIELEALLDELVTELEGVERTRDLEALERADDLAIGWRELHPLDDAAVPLTEGERARVAAAHRDRRVLDAAFARWFPVLPTALASVAPEAGGADAADLSALTVVLDTVADVVELVGGTELTRRSDAIELVERLLDDASLPPWRYGELIESYPTQCVAALGRVQAAVEPGRAMS